MPFVRHGWSETLALWLEDQAADLRRWILIVGIVAIPILFYRGAADPFNVPKLAMLIILVGLAGSLRLAETVQGRPIQPMRALLVPFLLLVVPLMVSWVLSPYRTWSLFGEYGRFLGLVPYLAVACFGVLVADAFVGDPRRIAWAVAIASGTVGSYAVVQALRLDVLQWAQLGQLNHEALSTLGNPNFTGGFLGIALPITIALSLDERGLRRRAWVLSALTLAGLIASFSQGGWAGSIAGSAVTAGFILRDRYGRADVIGGALAGFVGAALIGVVLLGVVKPETTRLPETVKLRALWLQEAVSMGADSPLFGHGPGTFALEGVKYRLPREAADRGFDFTDDPHSVPASFFASAGFLGLIGFLGLLWWALSKWGEVRKASVLGAGFLGAVVAYFVQGSGSIDELSLRFLMWVSLAGLVAALSAPAAKKAKPKKKTGGKKGEGSRTGTPLRLPLVGACALLALVVTTYGGRILYADIKASQGIASFRSGNPVEGTRSMEAAIGNPPDSRYRHLLGFYQGRKAVAEGKDGGDWLERSLATFDYLDELPSLPALRDMAVLLHEFTAFDPSLTDLSADVYARAMALDRYNSQLLLEGATALQAAGRDQQVVKFLEPVIAEVFPEEPSLWLPLAISYERVDRSQEALAALRMAEAAGLADWQLVTARQELGLIESP